MAQEPDATQKCSRCRVPIVDGDLVLRHHGDWYHGQCASLLPGEPSAVLCGVCGTGIRSASDLVMNGSAPLHVRCRSA